MGTGPALRRRLTAIGGRAAVNRPNGAQVPQPTELRGRRARVESQIRVNHNQVAPEATRWICRGARNQCGVRTPASTSSPRMAEPRR